MNIFITGASGFVGGAIAKHLSRNHSVRCMSRSAASDAVIQALGCEPVRCALGAVDAALLANTDTVIHAAAFVGDWGSHADYWQANVVGTEQLLASARSAGVHRFIHIGTEAALWYGQDMVDVDETCPYAEDSPFLYAATKATAEIRVLDANRAETFTTLSIRPRMVWGPGDQTILPAVRSMVEAGKFVWINQGKVLTSTTHIANLVHAVELALTRGNGGEAYFVADEGNTSLREFLTRLLATVGVTPPATSLPKNIVYPLAVCCEWLWRLLRLQSAPPLTRHAIGLMSCHCTLRIDKARRDLGYVPLLTVAEGMAALTRAAS